MIPKFDFYKLQLRPPEAGRYKTENSTKLLFLTHVR